MAEIDKQRWLRLSPLLDELLDLEPQARAARLDALRAQDPGLAEELEPLLRQQQALEGSDFLAGPPPMLGEMAAAAAAAPPLLAAGQQLGAYTLERELGQGGMGTVWLARRTDGRFEGQVAIKLLNTGVLGLGSQGGAARFAREGQILARLSHPHIARLLDAGVAPQGQQPYLVLEYVDGEPINRYCEQQQLDVPARVRLFLDVLAAVAHAHNRLILHRDLKPSNILVAQGGDVKLLDFGIAKLLGDATQAEHGAAATELTRQAGRAFTPQYAAPEQVQGGDVTTATDVYALGVLLYVLLSGQHPTAGRTESELDRLREVVEIEPRRLSEQVQRRKDLPDARRLARELRGDLDTILARALKKAPSERYPTAEALAQDLRRWLAHEPILARPDSAGYRFAKFVRRHRLGVAAGSTAVLAIAAGAGLALWKAHEAHEQRIEAEGLIEFMLGDLRKKLDPVGRLDVLDAVGDKALAYYSRQDLARSDADSLGRRARALHLMGEIAEKRGKMDEAEQRFNQAAESTAELLARDPKNTQRLFDHAQSSYWVGYAAWRQGKREVAQPRFEDYLRLAQTLVELEPGKAEWQMELAWAEHNLGVLHLATGEVQASLSRLGNARKVWTELLVRRREAASELGKTLGWLAEAQETLGLYDASIASHEEKLRLLMQEGVNDRKAQNLKAVTYSALSRLRLDAGQVNAARAAAERALRDFDELTSNDPANLETVGKQSFARLLYVELELLGSSSGRARAELAAVESALVRLAKVDANKPDWAIKIPVRLRTAQLQLAEKEGSELAHPRTELAFLLDKNERAMAAAPKDAVDANARWALAVAELRLGDSYGDKHPTIRQARYEIALGLLTPLGSDYPDPRVKSLRAHALLRLGRTQEARTLAESLEATAYRHPEWQTDLSRHLSEVDQQARLQEQKQLQQPKKPPR